MNRWTWAALATMGLLFAASSIPDTGEEGGAQVVFVLEPELHNLMHIPAYALLSWLWWRALGARRVKGAAIAAGIAVLYGVTDEIHQAFVPGRYASFLDLALDTTGAALVVAWARYFSRAT